MIEPTPEQLKKIKEKHSISDEDHSLPETIGHISDGFFLTDNEVEELRNAKKELTDYGKQKFKEMTTGELMDTEKFQEEFSKSQVFDADKFEEENRKERSNRILERYNYFYNTEVSGLSHGTPTSMEQLQCITLECMLDALRYENLNHEFSEVQTADINALIEGLYQQGKDYLERVRTLQQPSQESTKTDLDAL